MHLSTILLILLYYTRYSFQLKIFNENTEIENFSETVIKYLSNYNKDNKDLVYLKLNSTNDILSDLILKKLNNKQWTIQMKNYLENLSDHHFPPIPNLYVIEFSTETEFMELFKAFHVKFFNVRAKVIAISIRKFTQFKEICTNLTNFLNKLNINNVTILLENFQFINANTEKSLKTIRIAYDERAPLVINLFKNLDLNLYRNSKQLTGINIGILNTIAEKLNLTMIYKESKNHPFLFKNGTATNSFNDLQI